MGILTNAGKQKILVATPLSPVNIKYMAFGTGQGSILPTQTTLKNEVYRGEASPARKDVDNPNNMIIQGSIPANVGGFTLFEVGLFDVDNVLIAIASLDDGTGNGQYKPVTTGILATRFTFDFIVELVNTTDFELIINDNPDFDHRNISHRDALDSHPISAVTGLQQALDNQAVHNNLTGRSTADAHPISAITGLQAHITDAGAKDDQNVKLTGDQTIDGYKTFNGNIGVETINNGNATITLEGDGVGISAGSGPTLTAINIDASSKAVNITGQLNGDGSGLLEATTAKRGTVQLATSAEVVTGTNATKAITPSTLKAGLGATGNAPLFGARAWVNFNGATGAIRASGNVASVVRNSIGNYTINFTTAMPNANYAAQTSMSSTGAGADLGIVSQAAGTITLQATYGGDNTIGAFDPSIGSLTVFC